MCLWAAYLGKTVLPETVKKYLSAVACMYVEEGLLTPTFRSDQLRRVLLGLERLQLQLRGPHVRRPRTPLTARRLRLVLALCSTGSFEDLTFRAMCVTGYFGFLRLGEMSVTQDTAVYQVLREKHFWLEGQWVRLIVPYSKVDRFARGHPLTIGRTMDPVLDVATVMEAMQSHPAYGVRAPHQPLFRDANGSAITRQWFTTRLAVLCKRAGLINVTGHSLRRGAATDAAAQGVHSTWIQALGRWSSDCYQIYMELQPSQLADMAGSMIGAFGTATPTRLASDVAEATRCFREMGNFGPSWWALGAQR